MNDLTRNLNSSSSNNLLVKDKTLLCATDSYNNAATSDSENDASNDNLSVAERRVLLGGERQAPQGQETYRNTETPQSNSTHTTNNNTLVIRNNSSIDSSALSPLYGNVAKLAATHYLDQEIADMSNGNLGAAQARQALYAQQAANTNAALLLSGVQEITEIPKHYLDQSEVLKHLAKEVQLPHRLALLQQQQQQSQQSGPGPSPQQLQQLHYQQQRHSPQHHMHQQHLHQQGPSSQAAPSYWRTTSLEEQHQAAHHGGPRSVSQPREIMHQQTTLTHDHMSATVLLNRLQEENVALKNELDMYYGKVSRLQKLEMELQQLHEAHQDLVRSTEKRENLELQMRSKLEREISRLQEMNRHQRQQLDTALAQITSVQRTSCNGDPHNESELKKELSRRDVLIAQLLGQNKELQAEKERRDIELSAQQATLDEQRNHIDILDNALTNTQANVMRLEDENRKKQFYVERVNQLQTALQHMQEATERRLHLEKQRLMEKLQQEGGLHLNLGGSETEEQLKRKVREYEQKIVNLEAEVAKWEKCYLEESTMRQIAVDAASVPKDAKIAALERTSQESEKLIAQVRSEKLKQMDELYALQRKCAEQESKLKDMESRLAEKDAMIRVLQHHSQEHASLYATTPGNSSSTGQRPPRHPATHTRAVSSSVVTLGGCGGTSSSSSTMVHHHPTGSDSGTTGIRMSSVASTSTSSTTSSAMESCGAPLLRAASVPPGGGTDAMSLNESPKQRALEEQLKELRLANKESVMNSLQRERGERRVWKV